MENSNLLSAISISGRLFTRLGNFLEKRKGLISYYGLFRELASRCVRRIQSRLVVTQYFRHQIEQLAVF